MEQYYKPTKKTAVQKAPHKAKPAVSSAKTARVPSPPKDEALAGALEIFGAALPLVPSPALLLSASARRCASVAGVRLARRVRVMRLLRPFLGLQPAWEIS